MPPIYEVVSGWCAGGRFACCRPCSTASRIMWVSNPMTGILSGL